MKILFIQTGGTIDKDYPKSTKGYAFEITEPAVTRIFNKIKPVFEFEILSLLQKDSLELNNNDRQKILDACLYSNEDKVIITHGTDTMIETAKFLSIIKDKTIVLTGATKPEKFKESDAEFNLGAAVGAIGVIHPGIYIAMNGRIFEYDKVKREEATGIFIDI